MENPRTKLDIKALLPHREPFLFVDELVEIAEHRGVGEKTFTPDDPIFSGHFPAFPVLPGVLICEFAFQTAAAWLAAQMPGLARDGFQPEFPPAEIKPSLPFASTAIPMVTRIRDVQFREVVLPGQKLIAEVTLEDQAANAYRFSARVLRGSRLVARLEFTCMVVDKAAGIARPVDDSG